jgi:CO/xanthine dehydrogenase FAD-binding subunit
LHNDSVKNALNEVGEKNMSQLKVYHRPANVAEALRLLARPQVNTVVLAGGTYLTARINETTTEVVDLQAAGLDTVHYIENRLILGAMVRLQSIVDDGQAPALLRQMAQREGANTLRNAATVGGVVVRADPESELLATLLAFEGQVQVQSPAGSSWLALPDFLADIAGGLQSGLVTAVSLVRSGQGRGERVARTPADRPIVAAVARRDDARQIHLALCGVAPTPILVATNLDQLKASLVPPGDFRGSSAYRRQVAITLSKRVIDSLGRTPKDENEESKP